MADAQGVKFDKVFLQVGSYSALENQLDAEHQSECAKQILRNAEASGLSLPQILALLRGNVAGRLRRMTLLGPLSYATMQASVDALLADLTPAEVVEESPGSEYPQRSKCDACADNREGDGCSLDDCAEPSEDKPVGSDDKREAYLKGKADGVAAERGVILSDIEVIRNWLNTDEHTLDIVSGCILRRR